MISILNKITLGTINKNRQYQKYFQIGTLSYPRFKNQILQKMNGLKPSNDYEKQSGESLTMKRQSERGNEMDGICFAIVRHNKLNSKIQNIILIKQLFSKCLPRMSKQHILSTILHEDHINLIMIRDKSQLIGAVTFRPFRRNRFIQIVFFAIQGKFQRKGFGTKLMNALKNQMLKIGIKNLLTYADNLAHVFFYRQGFSSKITLPNSQFQGLIKKYQGGTLMHCVIQQKKVQIKKIETIEEQKVPNNNSSQEKIIQEKSQQMMRNQKQQQGKVQKYQKPIQEKQLNCQRKVKKQSKVLNVKKQKKTHMNNSLQSNSLMKWIRKSQPTKTEHHPANQ